MIEEKHILLVFVLCIFTLNGYSSAYISEIKFLDGDFIEIYSDAQLNLTDKKTFTSRHNTSLILEPLIEKDSSFYLIVGNNFYNLIKDDYENLNCSIYRTKTTSTNYASGVVANSITQAEQIITIEINQTLNLSRVKIDHKDINSNLSLNYNSSDSEHLLYNYSVCVFPLIAEGVNDEIEEDEQNPEEIIEEISQNTCDYEFKINLKKDVFEEKIEYDFITNAKNYIIEYSVEDYLGDVMRNSRNSTNTNTKSYTPKPITNLYFIKANLYVNDCILNDSKLAIFYHYDSTDEEISNLIEEVDFGNDSYIKILNLEDIINLKSNFIDYEVYKADSAKRTIYFHLNKQRINSFELAKHSILKGRLNLKLNADINELIISGLDLEEKIIIYKNFSLEKQVSNLSVQNISVNEKEIKISPYFNIENFQVFESNIIFDINTSFTLSDLTCHVNHIRTRVTDIIDLINSNYSNVTIKLNQTQLKQREKLDIYPLRLQCKYIKQNTITTIYESMDFNFSIFEKSVENNISINMDIVSEYELSSYSYDNLFLQNHDIKNVELQFEKNVYETKDDFEYQSSNMKIKENAFYFIYIATVLLLLVFIWRW